MLKSKMKKKNKENNYAFIDSQNLNLGVKSQGWNLNFARFRQFLKDKYQVNKAYLFIGYVFDNQSLYTELQKAGCICIFKPTLEIKERGKTRVKGNVDAELVLHTMIEYKNYDKAVIVSGDGDFYCLIEYLVKQNKLCKIIVPNTRFSSLIRKYSKFIVNIQLFKKKLTK
ncbi:MAG: hypothetical protein CO160_00175 [Candidatus Portnoybacteria bacterium CG_4_9_14_3_um_filter_43_11]|uniref:NYN domain-containing protein n=1 Tax=Candidatus Portnoybacteria bacterium CG_4_9_14_3_um_filter_43_11 TaxID=1974805 RepID=A0A2M7YMC3_9BACT|nr:MAG: hypothetical protein CO160_00175 [Candidatus Portnoybacteria bacterium CG_4_9_14_3_um_filter_43_11]